MSAMTTKESSRPSRVTVVPARAAVALIVPVLARGIPATTRVDEAAKRSSRVPLRPATGSAATSDVSSGSAPVVRHERGIG